MKLTMDQQDGFGRPLWRASTDDDRSEGIGSEPLDAVTNLAKILESKIPAQAPTGLAVDDLGRPKYSFFPGGQHYHVWKLIASYGDGRREWVCRERYPLPSGLVTDCNCAIITFR